MAPGAGFSPKLREALRSSPACQALRHVRPFQQVFEAVEEEGHEPEEMGSEQ